MVIKVFTDGASRGNPGLSGVGVVIYKNEQVLSQVSKFTQKKTNNEAEYLAVILAIEELLKLGINKAKVYSDSEFLVKQLNGKYKVKAANIKSLYEIVTKLQNSIDLSFFWVRREENAVADALANKGIDERNLKHKTLETKPTISKKQINSESVKHSLSKNHNKSQNSNNLILNKSFFGKINCLKIQMNLDKEIYFHLGILKEGFWTWEKVKVSDSELGLILNTISEDEEKCSFFHKFENKNTQIWFNKTEKNFNIRINKFSKNLIIGEIVVLKILLEELIKRKNFI